MSDSHATTMPEAKIAAPADRPPVRENQVEAEVDRSAIAGQRMMRSIGGGSLMASPDRFAGALGQMQSASGQAGMLRQLQRSYGNSYVGNVIQAKLTVNQPGDIYEQEADRMAAQVMAMPQSGSIQREIDPKKEKEKIQMMPSLQRASDGNLEAGGNLENRLNSSKGGGNPLPDDVRSFMEPRFGADFSQVRVHTGSESVQMNQDLNAQAFTHRQDVYFGAGKAPAKDVLTAHELTHVVQQKGAVQTKEAFNKPNVQLKCSVCDEKPKVQRSVEISSILEMRVQRSWFGDDDEKKEPENSSGGGILDWAKEKASGAVDSVTQAVGDAYDWAKEKSNAALDIAIDRGRQALDISSNWRSIQPDWNSEPGMILRSWANKLDPEIVRDISRKSPADVYNLIDVPDQIQQAAKELAKQARMDIPGFAPSPNIPLPDIDIPGVPDRKPTPSPVPAPTPAPIPETPPSSPSPLLFLLLLAGIIIFLAILYYGSKKKVGVSPGSGASGGGESGGGGSSDSFADDKTPEDENKGGCPEKKFNQEYLTAKDLINESENYRNKHGAGIGHMVRDHVGKDDKVLCERACDPNRKATTASTFKDRAEADASIQNILNNKKNSIKQWATDASREIGDENSFSVQQANVGKTATCIDANKKSCSNFSGRGVKIFVIFDPSWKVGKGCFWMLTGHPTK